MITDELGKQLHDKYTRGIPLSSDEQEQLENWYEYHDNLEQVVFDTALHTKMKEYQQTIADQGQKKLWDQIEASFIHLAKMTKRIQEIAAENDILRQEVSRLRAQVGLLPIQQAA